MSEAAGLVNEYVCTSCTGHTITKNRDTGTTPFMISCQATPGCKGAAESSFYRVRQDQAPAFLFIKPTPEELDAHVELYPSAEAMIRQHVELGGLILVPAPTA